MGPPTKAPKTKLNVLALGQGKRVSQSAKSAILRDLQKLASENVEVLQDAATSCREIFRERKAAAERKTRFGPLLIERTFQTDEGPVKYPVQNPQAMLQLAMSESERYSHYVRDAIARHGTPDSKPWGLVIYIDEITCGNPLAVRSNAKRKVQGVYWALYDLGEVALADDACWFELVAFRTAETDDFVGNISHLLDVCLSVFFDPEGHDLRYGCVFDLLGHGQQIVLTLYLEMLIADIKALCEAIGSMGVSALLPCFLCRRVLSLKAKQKPELAILDDWVDLACLDATKWGQHSNRSLHKLLCDLKTDSTVLSADALKRKQTCCGYKHVESNFLLNPAVAHAPLEVIMLDWMHLFFQTGNWDREVYQILYKATTRTVKAYTLMAAYVSKFTFPRSQQLRPNLLCDKHWESCKEAEVFKCSASDGLTLYAVICKFFQDVLLKTAEGTTYEAELAAKVHSYVCQCDIIDLLQISKHGRHVDASLLDEKTATWSQAHATAYGSSLTYLKTHLTRHLGDMLRRRQGKSNGIGILLACWALDACVCICTIKHNIW